MKWSVNHFSVNKKDVVLHQTQNNRAFTLTGKIINNVSIVDWDTIGRRSYPCAFAIDVFPSGRKRQSSSGTVLDRKSPRSLAVSTVLRNIKDKCAWTRSQFCRNPQYTPFHSLPSNQYYQRFGNHAAKPRMSVNSPVGVANLLNILVHHSNCSRRSGNETFSKVYSHDDPQPSQCSTVCHKTDKSSITTMFMQLSIQ